MSHKSSGKLQSKYERTSICAFHLDVHIRNVELISNMKSTITITTHRSNRKENADFIVTSDFQCMIKRIVVNLGSIVGDQIAGRSLH